MCPTTPVRFAVDTDMVRAGPPRRFAENPFPDVDGSSGRRSAFGIVCCTRIKPDNRCEFPYARRPIVLLRLGNNGWLRGWKGSELIFFKSTIYNSYLPCLCEKETMLRDAFSSSPIRLVYTCKKILVLVITPKMQSRHSHLSTFPFPLWDPSAANREKTDER